MPEWTGESRKRLYHNLAEGRLTAVCEYLSTFPKLRKNDFKPVEKPALARFGESAKPELKRELAWMAFKEHQPTSDFALLCLKHLDHFPGDVLAKVFTEFAQICANDIERAYEEQLRFLAREHFGTEDEKTIKKVARMMPAEDLMSLNAELRQKTCAFIEIMLAHPTAAVLQAIRSAPEYLLKEIDWKLLERIKELEKQLKPGKPARKPAAEKKDEAKGFGSVAADQARKGTEPEPAQRATLIAALQSHVSSNCEQWNYMEAIPAAEKKRIRATLEVLARELDTGTLEALHATRPPVGAHYLMREYSVLAIRQFTRPVFLAAVDEMLRRIRKEGKAAKTDSGIIREKCLTIEWEALHAADELDPLFAVSRRVDDPAECHHYTNPKDLNLKTLRGKSRQEIREFLSRWEVYTWDGRRDSERRTWQMDGIRMFLDQPEYADLIAARLATCLESGSAMEADWAFRLAFEKPERLAGVERPFAALTACGMWQSKAGDAVKAVRRLHALAEHGRCTAAEAATAIEQAFTIEEPMLWREATEALRALMKKDTGIHIGNPERIRELLARDPAKYGKFLNPLLK